MKRWEQFEEDCCTYLNEQWGGEGVHFVKKGGSNAYDGDIDVVRTLSGKVLGKIETKLCPAQSGQFTLSEEDGRYRYSASNVYPENENAQKIVEWVNENRGDFLRVGQSGIPLTCPQAWLADWVAEHYRKKHVYFVITSSSLSAPKRIVPIHLLQEVFDITAVVRRKKSGSRHLPAKERTALLLRLAEEAPVQSVLPKENKTLVYFDRDPDPNAVEGYFLSRQSSGGYYIKKKGTTNGVTLIFSLRLKKEVGGQKTKGG